MEWFGAPPICFLPECRRAGQCRGNPQKGRFHLPPCFGHYREEYRFMIFAPGGCGGCMKEAGLPADAGEAERRRCGAAPRALAKGARRCSSCSTARIRKYERLRRSPHVRGPGGWEIDPEGFARYIEAGDWRNPEGVCYRPPIRYGNGWSIERAACPGGAAIAQRFEAFQARRRGSHSNPVRKLR